MAVKTRLRVILKAGSVVVAESQDPALWQATLAAMTRKDHPGEDAMRSEGEPGHAALNALAAGNELRAFAKMIGVAPEVALAASRPTKNPPFIHLDERHYSSFKHHTPQRGRHAISGTTLAATLLALWFKFAKLGSPTLFQVRDTLATIGLHDRNAHRTLRNCEWLQLREGRVHVNPVLTAKALQVAKSYCLSRSAYVDNSNISPA